MTSIALSVLAQDFEIPIERGALARVTLLADSRAERPSSPWSWNGAVPIGSGASRIVELGEDGGIYEVEVIMPSGSITGDQITVRPGEAASLSLEPQRLSASDWTFWRNRSADQHHAWPSVDPDLEGAREDDEIILGGSALVGGASGTTGSSKTRIAPKWGLWRQLEMPFEGPAVDHAAFGPTLVGWTLSRGPSWEHLRLAASTDLLPYALLDPRKAYERVEWVSHGATLRSWHSDESVFDPHPWKGISELGERAFVTQVDGDSRRLASLPLPWIVPGTSEAARVEVSTSGEPDPLGARLGVTVFDSVLGGMLEYLRRGNVLAARTIVDDLSDGLTAESILCDPNTPLAAVAVAYVISATQQPDGEAGHRWERCLERLVREDPWLPDASILLARWMVRRSRTEADLDAARDALTAAYGRGLPFFTAGVGCLADGLSLLAIRYPGLEELHARVAQVRAMLDPTQAFTVLRLDAPRPADA